MHKLFSILRCGLGAAQLLLALVISAPMDAQRDTIGAGVIRRECLRHTSASARGDRSWETSVGLRNCTTEEAIDAVVSLWQFPPSDSVGLTRLAVATTGGFHAKILNAVTTNALDVTQPPNVRATAVVILGYYLTRGDLDPTPLKRLDIGSDTVWPTMTARPSHSRGNANEFLNRVGDISANVERIKQGDPHPIVRRTADLVLAWFAEERRAGSIKYD